MKPESIPRRLLLDVALTSRCPLRCRFCPVDKSEATELSAGQWRELITAFARLRPMVLTGSRKAAYPSVVQALRLSRRSKHAGAS